MQSLNRLGARWSRWANNPPLAMRVLYPPAFFALALVIGIRRGWVIGIVAAVVYGGLGLSMSLWPQRTVAWSRRRPGADGALLGPLLFLALAYLTPLSVWWCLGLAVLGSVFGFGMGRRRGRRLQVEQAASD